MIRTALALVAVIFAVAALIVVDTPASAQSDDTAGRIVARKLADGRVEFGWQPSDGERVLPAKRYFPASGAPVDRWLRSSPVEVGGAEIGRINARLLDSGRIEFGFTPIDGERILPPSRYFPATGAQVGRWLRSTEITISIAGTPGFTAISAGSLYTCGLRESGEIECWGSNESYVYNPGTERSDLIYTGQIEAPAGIFIAVSAGSSHACGLRKSGEIECWGSNVEYVHNPATQRTQAILHEADRRVPPGSYTAVSAGNEYTCGLRDDGAITCWGYENSPYGQTVPPSGSFTAVSAGSDRTCGLRETGAIECWGYDYQGQFDTPDGSFAAVSVGRDYTCGLREGGEIACWGFDGGAKVGVPGPFLSAPDGSFRAVNAGNTHTCGLRNTGEIQCWGYDFYGQLDAPAGSFIAVSAGWTHTCGLRESGEVECWGNNEYRQTAPPTP